MTTVTAAKLRTIPSLSGTSPVLDLTRLPADPVTFFYEWLDGALASQVAEPLAITLATVDADGAPNARTLIVKDIDDRGWAFAGPRESAKGIELASHPAAALNFWWQPLVRAIRVRGPVVEASRADSEADFALRSAAARRDLDSRDWVLWRLQAERVEFWQGSPDRQHIRIIYRFIDGVWSLS
ncbi:pyridoxal 5'-phosphate synthase [Leifsonia sp. A12D58]|uniref:pyridoxine/pyridoxamine 5'-phosphate oxidase n=1 Tax=Leifsonia sp. A12D58 TaxID=3397674 RepID=UPI0039E104CB